MQRRLITVILFALVAAFASSMILYRVISAKSAQASNPSATEIYVAAHDLSAGALIGPADLRVEKWPGSVSAQWVSRREDLIGRPLLVAINSGEPFPDNRLAAKGAGVGFASGIPPGMRVVPVHVDELSGLSRLIMTGMHVDVLSTESAGGAKVATRTILQNVKVLSIDQAAQRNAKDKSAGAQSANLLVTPHQAEILSQAIAQNRIQLVLRNPLDDSNIVETVEPAPKPAPPVRKVREAPPPEKKVEVAVAPPPPPPAPLPTIEIVHGSKRTVTVVSATAPTSVPSQGASQEVTR
jgi:pilus assembly protein CpaB